MSLSKTYYLELEQHLPLVTHTYVPTALLFFSPTPYSRGTATHTHIRTYNMQVRRKRQYLPLSPLLFFTLLTYLPFLLYLSRKTSGKKGKEEKKIEKEGRGKTQPSSSTPEERKRKKKRNVMVPEGNIGKLTLAIERKGFTSWF